MKVITERLRVCFSALDYLVRVSSKTAYFARSDSTEKSNVLRSDLGLRRRCSSSESFCVFVISKRQKSLLASVHDERWSWWWVTSVADSWFSVVGLVVVVRKIDGMVGRPPSSESAPVYGTDKPRPSTFGGSGLENFPPTSKTLSMLDFDVNPPEAGQHSDAVDCMPASETPEGSVLHERTSPSNLIAASSSCLHARSGGGSWYGVTGSGNKILCWDVVVCLVSSAWARSCSNIMALSSVSAKQRRLRMRAETASGRNVRPAPPPLTQGTLRLSTYDCPIWPPAITSHIRTLKRPLNINCSVCVCANFLYHVACWLSDFILIFLCCLFTFYLYIVLFIVCVGYLE